MDDEPSRDPYRNMVFYFAAVALACSPQTANEDVKIFKQLQKFRNNIHGSYIHEEAAENFSHDALDLLTRYAPAVMPFLLR
ncbi:hypothetical protein LWC34_54785 [Kibdelosporangium philippinense]|uniref:Uncharacterized protein n=1 Tax=Kibdelosporangium philippinense TaxID=211113 RepID=A0ABS8ZW33_9PSEU|nr:hypothetical protein [Kibdelosporangium philippinense]MCE7011827.1 hypothetical protein [Kibdelosporangium philippinense]